MTEPTGDHTSPPDLSTFYRDRNLGRDVALPDSPAEVGARIAEARVNAEMSRRALGEHLGVRAETIGRWERGRSTPRPNHLDRIAGLLGVGLSWLVIGRGEAPAEEEEPDLHQELAELRRTLQDALGLVDRLALRLGPPENQDPGEAG